MIFQTVVSVSNFTSPPLLGRFNIEDNNLWTTEAQSTPGHGPQVSALAVKNTVWIFGGFNNKKIVSSFDLTHGVNSTHEDLEHVKYNGGQLLYNVL